MNKLAERGEATFSTSGKLLKLVGILRGADIFWGGKPVLFHMHGDLLEGEGPRLLVRTKKG